MALRQKLWAHRKRKELLGQLGGVCACCGTRRRMEFDCIEPRGDRHHKMDSSARMCFYRKQHKLGNLQILCRGCHTKKTKIDLKTSPF